MRRGFGKACRRGLGLAEGRVTSRWTGREALTLASSPYRNTADLVRDVQAAAIAQDGPGSTSRPFG